MMKYALYIFSFILTIQGILLSYGISVYGARRTLEPNIQNILFSFIFGIICFIFAIKYPLFKQKKYKTYYKNPNKKKTKKTKPNQKQPKNPNPNKKLNIKQKDIKNIKRVIPKKNQIKGRHE